MSLRENPIGIYEKAIPNHFSFEEKIKIAKEAGYDFMEISIDESDERLSRLEWSKDERRQLRTIMDQENFHFLSMCLSGHRKYPFGSHDPKIREKAKWIMKKAIELASDLGIRNIQLAGYDVYYEEQDSATEQWFVEGLKEAVKEAARANVMLSIEIMDTPFMGTIKKGLHYIEQIKSPWLKIYPDLGNLTQWSDMPELELALGFKDIVAIHLKDTKPGKFKCVPFGEGTVAFSMLFNTLEKLNYQGPFLVEMWADETNSQTTETTLRQLIDAKAWLYERMCG